MRVESTVEIALRKSQALRNVSCGSMVCTRVSAAYTGHLIRGRANIVSTYQTSAATPDVPWYKTLNRKQWNTLLASNLGWLFDGFENYALILTAGVALKQLLDPSQQAQVRVFPVIILLFLLSIGLQIEFALRSHQLHWGRRRFNVLLIFRYVHVFTRPIRPLAQMRRNVAPRKITPLSLHEVWSISDSGKTEAHAYL